jgi:hypothetical protein
MNIFDQLEKQHSKENSLNIMNYIGKNKARFKELMECFFAESQDYRVPQRAAHVVSVCYDKHPELILPYIQKLIELLLNPYLKGPHKRNILRILQYGNIPEASMGRVYGKVFDLMLNPKDEIAVRAFAFTVLYSISQTHPELKPELKSAIEIVLAEENLSPGIQSRGKKTLQLLQKELEK